MTTKPRIMVFSDSYLPSHTSGGGVWTIVNLIERFADRYDFFVVTRNNDFKTNRQVYNGIESDAWNDLGNANVFYFSNENLNERKFLELFAVVQPDAIFLNSSLSTPTIKVLRVRRKAALGDLPVILAPCGELSEAALSLKAYKKKLFLTYANSIDLYRGVIWKATSANERDEVLAVIKKDPEIMIAPDLTPKSILSDYDPSWKTPKTAGAARFVFLSRVMRKKNLGFFLKLLGEAGKGNIELDIIGQLEDQGYWGECLSQIEKLGDNIQVRALGSFPNREALELTARNHFFVLPTLDENFGYVFIEALAAGCPLLISDRNIWTGIEPNQVGWRIPLDRTDLWASAIDQCVTMDQQEYDQMSGRSRAYSLELLKEEDAELANARVFERALSNNKKKGAVGLRQ
ncbi:MAG: glycosyltransferase family 4 protein [Acidobacteriota bacterium]